MIRRLYIDNQLVDIDEKTVISITYQYFNLLSDGISNPITRRVKISNSFNIPTSAKNMSILGHPGHINMASTKVYTKLTCDYFIGNDKIIAGATVKIESVGERVQMTLTEKSSIWDAMKAVKWKDFASEIWDKCNVKKAANFPSAQTFGGFLADYSDWEKDLIVLPVYGLLSNSTDPVYLNHNSELTTPKKGSQIWVNAITIFKAIEDYFNVDFGTGETFDGNIWNDAYAPNVRTALRDVVVQKDLFPPSTWDYYFNFIQTGQFGENPDSIENSDKSIYDYVVSFLQLFNVLVDETDEGIIKLRRFDDIETYGTVHNFSGKIKPLKTFKPLFDGYAQSSVIRWSAKFEGASENVNAKVLVCANENIEATNELFQIEGYVPNFFEIAGHLVPNLSTAQSIESFEFLYVDSNSSMDYFECHMSSLAEGDDDASVILPIPTLYGLSGEYQLLERIVEYPILYEIEKWITLADIKEVRPFRLFYFEELGGTFYINKITNFNPYLSKQPAKLELIKINDSKP